MVESSSLCISQRHYGSIFLVTTPCAGKIAAGKINPVSGKPWSNGLSADPQDYAVIPEQPWLDGFNVSEDFLRQRIYGLSLGYEDLNDHGELRHDPALQTAARRLDTLASPSTLCRLEQRADRETALAIHRVLFEQFVAAHPKPPRRLVLGFIPLKNFAWRCLPVPAGSR